MTPEQTPSLLSQTPEAIHRGTILCYQRYLDDFGTESMFNIVEETTYDARSVEQILVEFNNVIESSERVPTERRESLGRALLYHLARLCAGEYLFRSSSPDIMRLNQEALLLWPGQPLRNFGHPGPALEGAFWYVNNIRHSCTREIAVFGHFIGGGDDVPRQLGEGFDRLIEKIPEVRTYLSLISDEEYEQSDSAVRRLHDLYNATHGCDGEDDRKFDVRQPRLRPTEQRLVSFVNESEQPPKAEDIARGLRLNNNSHFRGSLSNLVRLEILAHAKAGGYVLGSKALMSGQKSGSKSGQSQD